MHQLQALPLPHSRAHSGKGVFVTPCWRTGSTLGRRSGSTQCGVRSWSCHRTYSSSRLHISPGQTVQVGKLLGRLTLRGVRWRTEEPVSRTVLVHCTSASHRACCCLTEPWPPPSAVYRSAMAQAVSPVSRREMRWAAGIWTGGLQW